MMMETAQQRLQEADGLDAVLDAAYAAFEGMVSVIHPVQDPASGLFAAFVLAAASAADGRNALALAPSLPGHPLLAAPAEQQSWSGEPPERVAEVVTGLSHLVAERLTQAADSAPDTGDEAACRNAARNARDICGLLSTGP
jgi:hypothetical protein